MIVHTKDNRTTVVTESLEEYAQFQVFIQKVREISGPVSTREPTQEEFSKLSEIKKEYLEEYIMKDPYWPRSLTAGNG